MAASDSAKTDDSLVVLKNSRYVGRNPLNSDHDSFDSTYEYASWDGTLADGEAAPNGNYQIRLRFVYSGAQSLGPVKTLLKLINGVAYRALKITGDRDQTNDYECVLIVMPVRCHSHTNWFRSISDTGYLPSSKSTVTNKVAQEVVRQCTPSVTHGWAGQPCHTRGE